MSPRQGKRSNEWILLPVSKSNGVLTHNWGEVKHAYGNKCMEGEIEEIFVGGLGVGVEIHRMFIKVWLLFLPDFATLPGPAQRQQNGF